MAEQNSKAAKDKNIRKLSWKRLLIAGSIAANIGFVVVFATMMTSHVLDGMLIKEGLTRYCAVNNDDKFEGSTAQTIALREFVCERNGAEIYFRDGFQKYLDAKSAPAVDLPGGEATETDVYED